MKRTLYILHSLAFICLICMVGCNKELNEVINNITDNEMSLNLVSPSGTKIAKNIKELKSEASSIICNSNGGIVVDFEITDIEFLPISKGYIAIIEYRMVGGELSNYIKATMDIGVKTKLDGTLSISYMSERIKTRTEDDINSVTYKCTPKRDGVQCKLEYSLVGDTFTVSCSHSECILSATFY